MLNILLVIILLSIIVLIHELGHLLVAKMFNVYCQEFSIGMGPKLLSFKGKETEYCIRAIPYGGFVAMAGDNENALETEVDTTNIPFERTLPGINPIKRILVMLAGIFMNIMLAIFIMSLVLLNMKTYAISPDTTIKITNNEYPAYQAGMIDGDKIIKITLEDNTSIKPKTFMELSSFLNTYNGNGNIRFEIMRDDKTIDFDIKPVFDQNEQRYIIGISSLDYKRVEINISNCFIYAIDYLLMITRMLLSTLKDLLFGRGLNNLSGPIGIYNTTAQAASLGMIYYFQLIALISLNVGIFNALPLPILDGGRVVMTIIEMIIKKPLSKKIQSILMTISIILIILLLLISTTQDILRLFK